MPILKNKKQYRKADQKFLDKLRDSMEYVGDVSGIVINLGTRFSPKREIIPFMNTNKVTFVAGHQRGNITQIDPSDIIIEERLKTPNKVGTLARGYIEYEGEKYNVRIVKWNKEQEDFALVASNELKGETDVKALLENVSNDILMRSTSDLSRLKEEMRRIREDEKNTFDMSQVDLNTFFEKSDKAATEPPKDNMDSNVSGQGGSNREGQHSLTLYFDANQLPEVEEGLLVHGETLEDGILNLLGL